MAVLLKELTALPGVSGYEDEVRQFIWKRARDCADRVMIDRLGSVIAIKKGDWHPERNVLVDAHMDEVGMLVSGIDEKGFVHFIPIGGLDARILPSTRVLVGSAGVRGIIGIKPIHLQKDDEQKKPIELDKMVIDVGASSREAAQKLVSVGDPVVFDSEFALFGDGMVKSRALDDRVGCALLLEALEERYPVTVTAVFSAQEEVGGMGARAASHRAQPDAALVLEGTTCADMHGVPDHMRVTRIGKGPAITPMERSAIADPALIRLIRSAAEQEGIPWQYREGNLGGTDAGPIQLAREGVPVAHIMIPCRYIHSGVSALSLQDFNNGRRLLRATLMRIHRLFEKED
ncbi:MAG: M42 family metallopeptidase [Christensenellales bacterium]|jgi:putative aminopeptidase FrvX